MNHVGRVLSHFATVFLLLFCSLFAFAGPSRTTYQAKIVKPDGYPLEASSVNFKFTILDPTGACILYAETYSSVNMSSTGGLISFSLGSGVKTYPVSSPTFADVFSNITPNLSCDAGGPVHYSPAANDIRKIVMQFHDGSGWQTLPAMNINAVPYAMYADEATTLSGKLASDFVQVSTIPTCVASQVLQYNGTSFSCLTLPAGVSITSGTIASALGYTPADNSSVSTVTATVSTLGTSVTALTSTLNTTANSATVLTMAMNNMVTSYSNLATSMASIVSSQWTTSSTAVLYNGGYVGIGNASPTARLTVGSPSGTTIIHDGDDSIQLFGNGNAYFQGRDILNNVEFIMGTSTSAGEVFSGSMSSHDYSLRTGNARRIIITASGTVGIGVASATAKLQIVAGTSSTPQLKLNTSVLTSSPQSGAIEYDGNNLYVTDSSNTRRTVAMVGGPVSSTDYTSAISATANITMTPSGSVVVSSTTASTNAATGALIVKGGLGVSGSIFTSGTITTTSNIQGVSLTATSGLITPIIFGGTGVSGNLLLESTTNATKGNVLITNGGGNVGIGTNTPLAKLSVDGDGFSPNTPAYGSVATFDNETTDVAIGLFTANTKKASYYYGVTGAASRGALSYQFNSTNAALDRFKIDVNSQERLAITGSGTVGIGLNGVSVPAAMLQVTNNNATQNVVDIKGANSQSGAWIRFSDSNDVTRAQLNPNGGMPQLTIGATNAIRLTGEYGGIDEVPSNSGLVSTSGHLALLNNGNSGIKTIAGYYNGTNYFSAWEIANVSLGYGSLLLMKSGGYVGIGTTSNTARLNIGSGTTTVAPLKIISGTLVSSPQSGTIEYDGFNFYVTDSSLVRRALASVSGSSTNSISTLNPTGNLTLAPTGSVAVSATNTNISGVLTVQNTLSVSNALGIGTSDTSMANIHIRNTSGVNDIIYIDRTDTSPNLDIYSSYNGLGNIQSGTFAYGVRPGDDQWQIWERGNNAAWVNLFAVGKDGKIGVGTKAPYGTDKFSVVGGGMHVGSQWYVETTAAPMNGLSVEGGAVYGAGVTLPATNMLAVGGGLTVGNGWFASTYAAPTNGVVIQGAMALGGPTALPAGNQLSVGGGVTIGNGWYSGTYSAPIDGLLVSGNMGLGTNLVDAKLRVYGKIKVGTETDTVSANVNPLFNDVFEVVSPGAASAPAIAFHQRGLHTVQVGSWGTSVTSQGIEIRSGPGEAAANLRVQNHISTSNGNLHTTRGRVAFSNTPTDANHTIYNNINNLDGEGAWDGMKMNVYQGLSVRVGQANASVPTTALFIDPSANVGIGTGTATPLSKLHVNGDLTLSTGSKFTWPLDGGGGGGDAAYIRYHFDEGGEDGSFDFVTQNDANDDMKFKAGYFSFLPNAIGNGYMGIGTSAPTQKLDVIGNVKATAFIGDGSQLTNIPGSAIQYNEWGSGWAGGAVPWSSYSYGMSGWQDYSGAATGLSTYWTGWTTRNGATGAQIAVNWNSEAGQTGGVKVRAKDDTQGNWGTWRDLAFTDASVQKTGDTMTGSLTVNADLTITGTPYRAGGDVAWQIPSDKRLKDVKSAYNRGLKELLNIETIIYTYKKENPKHIDSNIEYTGVLAQNVQANIPEAVKVDKDGFLSLNTTPIFWAMVNAIKDLYHDITGVQREIASLKEDNKAKDQEIKELKERLDRIEKALQQSPAK